MALQLIVVADNGHIFADQFMVIKPSRGTVVPGLVAEVYERCGTYLGKAELLGKNTIRPKQLSDAIAYITTGHDADYAKAAIQKQYPTEPFIDLICAKWVERELSAWNILTQMRWDAIHKAANVTLEIPQLFLIPQTPKAHATSC